MHQLRKEIKKKNKNKKIKNNKKIIKQLEN